MRSIYRGKKIIRRQDGCPVCVLDPLPQDLNDDDRGRAEALRAQIKAEIRGWLLGGRVLIDVFDDGHAEPAPYLWEVWSDPNDPLVGECWEDPINTMVQEVFVELHGHEFCSARNPAETSPDEDLEEWIAWALRRNGYI